LLLQRSINSEKAPSQKPSAAAGPTCNGACRNHKTALHSPLFFGADAEIAVDSFRQCRFFAMAVLDPLRRECAVMP